MKIIRHDTYIHTRWAAPCHKQNPSTGIRYMACGPFRLAVQTFYMEDRMINLAIGFLLSPIILVPAVLILNR